ncbi:hypothetical protein BG653_04751 [Streptomyces platensis]|uniref:Uncharacterized protein n=1 Tax=Streptomyces platensis TaxID=58346 RepID=A0ABX3XSJ3_STRPT|nr:hypothetical protein BG653_04751 [Streptomyces platensis]
MAAEIRPTSACAESTAGVAASSRDFPAHLLVLAPYRGSGDMANAQVRAVCIWGGS